MKFHVQTTDINPQTLLCNGHQKAVSQDILGYYHTVCNQSVELTEIAILMPLCPQFNLQYWSYNIGWSLINITVATLHERRTGCLLAGPGCNVHAEVSSFRVARFRIFLQIRRRQVEFLPSHCGNHQNEISLLDRNGCARECLYSYGNIYDFICQIINVLANGVCIPKWRQRKTRFRYQLSNTC